MLGRLKGSALLVLVIIILASAFSWAWGKMEMQTCSLQEVSQNLCRPAVIFSSSAWIFSTTISTIDLFTSNPFSNITHAGLLRRPLWLPSFSLPPSSLEEISEKESDFILILELGDIASLEAKQSFIKALLGFILEQLIPETESLSSFAGEEMSLTFNLGHLKINPVTSLVFAFDPDFNLYLDNITVTISSGPIKSETELDLKEGNLKGNFAIEFKLGTAIVSSITTFEEGQGLTKEILELSTAIGTINLNSRITLTSDLQEFQIQATIAGMAFSGTSILLPEGYWQWQSLGFEFKF